MNSLEEQIRAATRAAAEEISMSDVPAERRAIGRPSAGTHGFRRWVAPMAAAAAVIAIIGVAGALITVVPGHHPAANPRRTVPRVAKPAYPPNLESGLVGLFVTATGAQYTAGALLVGEYKALEGEVVAKCMAANGFRFQPASPAEIAKSDWDLTQFPDLGAIARAGALPSYSSGPLGQQPKGYTAAFGRCGKASTGLFQAMESAGTRLETSWLPIVTQIEKSAPVLATMPGLRGCAARYGWPGQPYRAPDSAINSFADFVDWVVGHLDGAESRGAPAAEMSKLSRHWGTVFLQCARPTVTVMERLQIAAQEKFLRQHERQFTALVTAARADFAAANKKAGR